MSRPDPQDAPKSTEDPGQRSESSSSIDVARKASMDAVAVSLRAVRDAISTTKHSISENHKFVQQVEQAERHTSQDAITASAQALKESMAILHSVTADTALSSEANSSAPGPESSTSPEAPTAPSQINAIIEADMQRIKQEQESVMRVFQQAAATLTQACQGASSAFKREK